MDKYVGENNRGFHGKCRIDKPVERVVVSAPGSEMAAAPPYTPIRPPIVANASRDLMRRGGHTSLGSRR